jgi:hypothetical protein
MSCQKRNSIDRELMPMSFLITIWYSKLALYMRKVFWGALLIIFSPISPSHMDWSPFYPGFVEPSSGDANGKNEPQADTNSETVAAIEAPTKNTGDIKKLTKDVEVADIGCGFGGLLVALAPKLPDTLMLGIYSLLHL